VQWNKVGEPKLFRLFGRFSIIVLVGFTTLSAQQSFKDFKKSQSGSFKSYKDERDNAFNNYLKQEWEAYKAYKSEPLYEKPKPLDIEAAKPQEIKPVGPKVVIKIREELQKEPVPVIVPKEPEIVVRIEEKKPKDITFDFFGTKLALDIPVGIKNANYYPQSQVGVVNFFSSAANSDYEPLLLEINRISQKMNLNDWGLYLLVSKISNMTYANQENSNLLSWFIFNKLGYAVKIGLEGKHIVLLHHSKKTIYSTPNYEFDNKKYYVIANYAKGSPGRIFSYKQDYPGSTRELDLSLKTLPNLEIDIKSKNLNFSYSGKEYGVEFSYNKNLIDFMASYPQADYETFFNAPVDDITYRDLAKSLKRHIDGKKASEAMNFVLNFVQKSFKYEQDNEQFGREKVMFAQETLYFDKSDCEDRAVLFSYLIKELFGVSVLGVKYSDHMATAVYVPIEGDEVMVKSKKFVIADPTYINATIGMSMPKYKSIKPQSYIVVREN
jgi:hypothetical protein